MKKISRRNFLLASGAVTIGAALAACGGSSASTSTASSAPASSAAASGTSAAGKVLNIWCWNDEFQSRFNDYYPEVSEIAADKSTTTLKDGTTEVQAHLSDWDKFNDVAAQASAKGYKMLSGFDDAYRTFSNNVAAPWVDGTTVTVDENIMKWVEQTKEYTDKGYNNKSSLWDSQWAADQGPTGKVFGFFYSTWGINFTLLGNSLETPVAEGGKEEVGNGIYGDYAVCEGPQPYYWGGTWICGAAGSDNIEIIRDVMQKLTCDEAIMKQITLDTQDYTNNEKAMEEIAGSDYKSDFLGGQNHIALFAEAAKKIDMSNAGPYDQGLNESFQTAFKDYFTGNVDEDTAKANFETAIKEKYPELTDVVWPA